MDRPRRRSRVDWKLEKSSTPRKDPLARLRELFERNGYLRVPNPRRRKKESADDYKKGCELRFVARSDPELRQIRTLLRRAGVNMGRPYEKHRQLVQPVYGMKAVKSLCEKLGIAPSGLPR